MAGEVRGSYLDQGGRYFEAKVTGTCIVMLSILALGTSLGHVEWNTRQK